MSARDPLPAKDMYFVICRTDWDEVADRPGKYGLARRSRPSFPTLEAAGKYAQGISLAREPIILRRVGEPDTFDAYPDGWTCQGCSVEFGSVLPALVPGATYCHPCAEEVKP